MPKCLIIVLCAAVPIAVTRGAETLKLIRVDSEEPENLGAHAVDGNPDTIWHTPWQRRQPPHPHEIVLQLVPPRTIEGLSYLPRQDGSDNGWIKEYEIYLSGDGQDFGQPVKQGEFARDASMKYALFNPRPCGYLKLVARSSTNGGPFTSAAEIGVVTANTFRNLTAVAEAVVPLADRPFVVPKSAAVRKQLFEDIRGYVGLPPEKVRAHRSAVDYPGVAPASAPRVTREISFNVPTRKKGNGWQSTGLYANAGEMVTVTPLAPLPEGVTVEIRIGCHTHDRLSEHFTQWDRFPAVVRSFALGAEATPVASAFGGTIFVEVTNTGELRRARKAEVRLRFDQAVEAPLFVLEDTRRGDWRTVRSAPAPWGELAGNGLVLHVPSEHLRNMKDPTSLMEWWDKVVAAQDELVGWPKRTSPERVVFERQMGGAWGYSGYPIMIDMSGMEGAIDLSGLRKDGNWGIFHEIGHNHQSDQWTFTQNKLLEQTEVTVNFFSLYCMEHIVRKPRGMGHPAIEGNELLRNLEQRFGRSPSDDAFEQLAPFVVLIRKYGWEPMQKTLVSYQTAPLGDDIPEPERQSEFVLRYSRHADADLSGFFRKSGYAVSKKVQEQLKSLPAFDYAAWRKETTGK